MRIRGSADRRLELQLSQLLRELPLTDPSHLRILVVGRVCRIHGQVSSYAEKQALARVLSSVPGLRGVVNQVRIAPEPLPYCTHPTVSEISGPEHTICA